MRAHPLPEARAYADLMLTELRKVIPSFLKRVDLDDRGVAWSTYLADHPQRPWRTLAARLFPAGDDARRRRPAVTLVDWDPDGEVQAGRRDALPVHATCPRQQLERAGAGDDRRRAARGRCGPTSASGPTAATSRAGPSSGSTTASTSWPTTAPSATCSATAC